MEVPHGFWGMCLPHRLCVTVTVGDLPVETSAWMLEVPGSHCHPQPHRLLSFPSGPSKVLVRSTFKWLGSRAHH